MLALPSCADIMPSGLLPRIEFLLAELEYLLSWFVLCKRLSFKS